MFYKVNERVEKSAAYISNFFGKNKFDVGIIAGTGIKEFTEALNGNKISYKDIPEFPNYVENESGELINATISDREVLFFSGRLHYYQGYNIEDTVYPVRIMEKLKVKTLIMVNSSATLTENLSPGDIVVIKDHINMMGVNPLIGVVNKENKFVSLQEPYSYRLINLLKQTTDLNLKLGVYVGVAGPNFETPAEANFFRIIGGDIIGMSTVCETIAAHQCGMEVIALSCITNYSSALKNSRLSKLDSILLSENAEEKVVTAILNLIALL